MENYFVNGSLTNLIQGAIGFNQYQGSVVYEPYNNDLQFLLDTPGQALVGIGFSKDQALYSLRALLVQTGLFPVQ